MPKDLDYISKQIDKISKESVGNTKALTREIVELYKHNLKLAKEVTAIKNNIKSIEEKIDAALDVLNSFTIMLAEDDEDLEDNYELDSDQTWVANEENFWQNDEDDEI